MLKILLAHYFGVQKALMCWVEKGLTVVSFFGKKNALMWVYFQTKHLKAFSCISFWSLFLFFILHCVDEYSKHLFHVVNNLTSLGMTWWLHVTNICKTISWKQAGKCKCKWKSADAKNPMISLLIHYLDVYNLSIATNHRMTWTKINSLWPH